MSWRRTGDIAWSETGPENGEGVVLIHSLGTDRTMWDGQIDVLGPRFRVVAVDLPGHGSSRARPGEYTIGDLATDVLETVDDAGVGRFRVVGISLGGLIALWLAVNARSRVSGLFVANTAARLGSEESWAVRIDAVEEMGMEKLAGTVVPRFFHPEFPRTHPEAFARWIEVFGGVDPVGYIGCCAALRDADLTPEVDTIRCPTWVIAGELDVATPVQVSEQLHGQIDGSHSHVIPGAGHLSNLDQPDRFNAVLADFAGL